MAYINRKEHERLIAKTRELGETDGVIYLKSLLELYAIYEQQLLAIRETVKHYNEIAAMIRQEKPVMAARKYVRVRSNAPKI